jgi:hypothetical protein
MVKRSRARRFFCRRIPIQSEESIIRLANVTHGLDSGFPRARYVMAQQQRKQKATQPEYPAGLPYANNSFSLLR